MEEVQIDHGMLAHRYQRLQRLLTCLVHTFFDTEISLAFSLVSCWDMVNWSSILPLLSTSFASSEAHGQSEDLHSLFTADPKKPTDKILG